MSREETSELRAFLVRKTEQAVLLTNRPGAGLQPQSPHAQPREFWLPRSLISYSRTSPLPLKEPNKPEGYAEFVCTLPDWKVEENSLWDFIP